MNQTPARMGVAGKIAKTFLHSRITPLLIIASVGLGVLSLFTLPREEEPQIQVPMVDIMLAWPGKPVKQVERQLTSPVERQLWQIPGIEYLYSTSNDDGALLIARFLVGFDTDEALVRVRTRLDEIRQTLPPGAQVISASPRSIDDVPVLALTLWSPERPETDHYDLRRLGEELALELRKAPGVSRIRVLGGEPREIRIEPDPDRLTAAGISTTTLVNSLEHAGLSLPAGSKTRGGVRRELRAVSDFATAGELRDLAVAAPFGRPIRLGELARVNDGPGEATHYVSYGDGSGAHYPAVTIEVSKLPGVNATELTRFLQGRVEELGATLIPSDVEVTVTRDYGETAKHKSDDLIFHLMLATLSVVALIALALGWRAAIVVAIAIPVTLALTLFLYQFLGYTLNRVTLFALIFSIGILVDDAIVVVENIARHFHMRNGRGTDKRVVDAVDEVGNPTVLATITVIAAILPLAFVGGLMGPYMKPIPIGASLAMLFSLGVAFIVSPWASRRVLRADHRVAEEPKEGKLDLLYRTMMGKLLEFPRWRIRFFALMLVLFGGAVSLVVFQIVTVKMLPFDNKSEFEVVLDMPPGTPLENTLAVAKEMSARLSKEPEVLNTVIYAGAGAPVNFNGLVRHYDFRREPRFADIQVNLVHAGERQKSHPIARRLRPLMTEIAEKHGARVKVVEVPPGPPVLSTLVAEIYGPDLDEQRQLGHRVWNVLVTTPGVVDSDLLLKENQPRSRMVVDRDMAALAGVSPGEVTGAMHTLFEGRTIGVLRAENEARAVPIRIRLAEADRADLSVLESIRLGPDPGTPVAEMGRTVNDTAPPEIYHKNLRRVVYVLGDVAGEVESPVYAIGTLRSRIDSLRTPDGNRIHQLSTKLPDSDENYSLKWDGEWHITYEVFRDMGAAFGVVLLLIYVIAVGWFRSFVTPFVIMIPIPLSLVGILPAHALLGAFFTATSMIGFIAGAGITVRNSIILVDFIELRRRQGMALKEAVIDAGAVRFRPMVLTAAAVAVGAGVILFDPIFQGLAVALIGGEIAATVLSRVAVPILYFLAHRNRPLSEEKAA
jgi:multidrug efflux pump subunit AcrB